MQSHGLSNRIKIFKLVTITLFLLSFILLSLTSEAKKQEDGDEAPVTLAPTPDPQDTPADPQTAPTPSPPAQADSRNTPADQQGDSASTTSDQVEDETPIAAKKPNWRNLTNGRDASNIPASEDDPSGQTTTEPGLYDKHQLAYYLTAEAVTFVRAGLKFTIQNAFVGDDRRIRVVFLITDDMGLPLDRLGVTTPGVVATSFVAAYIPNVASQYVAYTTRIQTSPITKVSAVQGTSDSGGSYQQNADGSYTYTFGKVLPADYDKTVTTTVALYGSRDLSPFDLGVQYFDTEFSWVPTGTAVTTVRDVVRIQTCNHCHDPLALHGGPRREIKTCVLCHNPQSSDPDTGNTVDLKVMVHKIHEGPNLPSVKAGHPYQIIGFGQSVNDFSGTTFPRDPQDCSACHDGSASQALNYLFKPAAATCGSCHDDVNFTTGANHPAGPQPDTKCAVCHIPEGDTEFDASVKGAHTIPRFSRDLPGVNFEILSITNTGPGQKPSVKLKITDKSGFPIETSQMSSLSLVIAGPNTDFNTTWSENARTTPSSGGILTYTFTKGIPSDATGSYSVGVEGYRSITLQPGTSKQVTGVRDAGFNKVLAFAVTDSQPVARREVVAQTNCNSCHGSLYLHGGSRQNVQYCVFCHNPVNTDVARRPANQLPPESIHLKTMVHKIHTGENLVSPFTIYGFSGSTSFNDVTFPGDRRDCEKCHNAGTEELPLPRGVLPSSSPRDFINPTMQPIAAACLACHGEQDTAAHALINTHPTLGESCRVCHGQTSDFSVDKVHAR